MALRLQALYDDVVLPLSDQPTVLGRSRELRVSSTGVSRHACSCFQDGPAAAKIVVAKRIYVMRKGADDAVAINKDDTLQVQSVAGHFKAEVTTETTIVLAKIIHERQCLNGSLSLQMELGDIVYLAATEGSKFEYGFKLLGPDRVAREIDKVCCVLLPNRSCARHFCASVWQLLLHCSAVANL